MVFRALADKTQTCGDGRYNDGGVCKGTALLSYRKLKIYSQFVKMWIA